MTPKDQLRKLRAYAKFMTPWDWTVIIGGYVLRFLLWFAIGATIAKVWWPR